MKIMTHEYEDLVILDQAIGGKATLTACSYGLLSRKKL